MCELHSSPHGRKHAAGEQIDSALSQRCHTPACTATATGTTTAHSPLCAASLSCCILQHCSCERAVEAQTVQPHSRCRSSSQPLHCSACSHQHCTFASFAVVFCSIAVCHSAALLFGELRTAVHSRHTNSFIAAHAKHSNRTHLTACRTLSRVKSALTNTNNVNSSRTRFTMTTRYSL